MDRREMDQREESAVYAVVRNGGRQHRVAVGDSLDVDLFEGEPGSTMQLPAILLVDGTAVTSDPETLAGVSVTGRVEGLVKGPKITILKFKNKTGYRRRAGHRQKYLRVTITDISGIPA
jgi:large subunit ribosomal protein L21